MGPRPGWPTTTRSLPPPSEARGWERLHPMGSALAGRPAILTLCPGPARERLATAGHRRPGARQSGRGPAGPGGRIRSRPSSLLRWRRSPRRRSPGRQTPAKPVEPDQAAPAPAKKQAKGQTAKADLRAAAAATDIFKGLPANGHAAYGTASVIHLDALAGRRTQRLENADAAFSGASVRLGSDLRDQERDGPASSPRPSSPATPTAGAAASRSVWPSARAAEPDHPRQRRGGEGAAVDPLVNKQVRTDQYPSRW